MVSILCRIKLNGSYFFLLFFLRMDIFAIFCDNMMLDVHSHK